MAAQKAPSVVYYVFRGFLLLCLRLVCCRYPERVFHSFSRSVVKPLLFFMVFFGRGFLFGYWLVSLGLSRQPVNDVEGDRLRNNDAEGSESAHGHHVRLAAQND